MDNLIDNLSAIVGSEYVLSRPDELLVYECDGLPHHKHRPRAVVFPSSTDETAAVMRELARAGVCFTPRGAGTGLSGGALALNSGVVIELARMRQILRIDVENRLAVVQPGVVNLHVSRAVAPYGLYYVPDPSSQPSCTIGGNIAESAGGIHCLKYGTTTDHVLGCRVVLAGGEIVDLGGAGIEAPGYDLLGTFIGSEGTFGIATEATLKLAQSPPTVRTLLAEFGEVNDASHAVSAIIAAGVMPAALEMMDGEIIRAVEASIFAAGLPPDAGAALLIELDGIEAGLDDEAEKVTSICMEYGARTCRYARDEAERKKLWAARKGAFGAIGRITPDSMIQDAVVPRSRLPQVLGAAYDIAARYQLRIANVFHAGDGNLHPLICFDSRFPEEVRRVKEAGRELMEVCVRAGGSITGEHGVGLDKRELLPLVFSDTDMNAMLSVRAAFDPLGLCNPGKIVPMLRGCGEGKAVAAAAESRPSAVGTFGPAVPRQQHATRAAIARNEFYPATAAPLLAQVIERSNISAHPTYLQVFPTSTEQVSEILKLAAREQWRVLPSGSATWINAETKSVANLIINTSQLDQIVEHEPADLIAIAQAGVKLSDFNEKLRENGQWLPLDPPDDGRATIGGVVATGLGGAQQFGYGRPRGTVIGMKVVLANGDVIRAGGRVVKNVAGYDLCKLFTGSFGTLGIITEVNFKLRPRPAREATLIVMGGVPELLASARAILRALLFPVAAEIISPAFANGLDIVTNDPVLLVRFAGNEKGVAYQLEQARAQIAGSTDVLIEDEKVWQSIAAAPLRTDYDLSWRASVLPNEVETFIKDVARIYDSSTDTVSTERGSAGLTWQIGALDGRMRMLDNTPRGPEETIALVDQLKTAARSSGGILIDETGLLPEPVSGASLMQRVKQQLDPLNILPYVWATD